MIWVDADGSLIDYVGAFAKHANCENPNREIYHIGDACGVGHGKRFEGLVHNFHEEGHQEFAGVMEDDLPRKTKEIYDLFGGLVILTARPVDKYPRMVQETWNWIRKNNIKTDGVVFSKDKEKYVKHTWLIEDCPKQAKKVADNGGWVYLIDRPYNQGLEHFRIVRVNGLQSVIDTFKMDSD
jgi:hypothetical protein